MRNSMRIAAALALLAGPVLAAPAKTPAKTLVAPVPEAREVPTTAASYPFLATQHNLVPLDLKAAGYEESESFVSGKANVYDWGPDGRPVVKEAGVPYATRILVRRPSDKSRFSGNVVVEIMHDARSSDWAMIWGYTHEKITRDGDIWVGVTLPKSTISLKKFDPARYAAMSFAPQTPLGCTTKEAGDTMEEGLRFDMLAQVGALLKSNTPTNPLAGYGPSRRLLMIQQGGDIATYAVVFQNLVRLAGGKPIYDGFVIKGVWRGEIGKLNHCAQAVPASDPRSALKNIGTPVIAMVSPGEVLNSLAHRREDSDDKADPYRRYEVAGANHLDRYAYSGFPDLADQVKAGIFQGTQEWPFAFRCTPEIQLSVNPVTRYSFNAALQNLAAWIKDGSPPPRASRIATTSRANGAPSVVLDANGVAVGGVRSVFSDLPTSADAVGSPGPGNCPEIGGTVAFSWSYLQSLYGSQEAYRAKALPMVDAMEKGRWLTPGDAEQLRAEIRAPAKPPVMPPS